LRGFLSSWPKDTAFHLDDAPGRRARGKAARDDDEAEGERFARRRAGARGRR